MSINKMWCVHSTEYASTIKRNKVLICDTAWIKLENITRRERNQTQKDVYCMITLTEMSKLG